MVSYCNDTWIAYLCELLVRQSCQKAITNCPACTNKLNSPLLHLHEQLSLLDKIRSYFNELRGIILQDLQVYYDRIANKLPHSDDKKKDMMIYINIARHFLLTSSADSIYFGRYLDEHNDSFINDEFVVKRAKKQKT